MNKRETAILFLMPFLAAGLLAVWAPKLLNALGHERAPKVKSITQDNELNKVDVFIKQTPLTARSRTSPFEAWGKDPFYASPIDALNAEAWPLLGIFWREDDPSALIGEDIVVVGDKLGEFVVTNITPDAVVISNGRKVIKLQVGKSFPKPDSGS